MKMSNVLKHVKKYVRRKEAMVGVYDRLSYFLCYAAEKAQAAGNISSKHERKVKTLFESRLRGYDSLEEWLEGKHGIAMIYYDDSPKYTRYRNKVQRTRIAWINSMIAEFRTKGN